MNQAVNESYQELAQALGLTVDETAGVLYGSYGGYQTLIYPANPGYPFALTVKITLADPLVNPDAQELKELKKSVKSIRGVTWTGRTVEMTMKNKGRRALVDSLTQAMPALTELLRRYGVRSGCEGCGQSVETGVTQLGASYRQLCPDCVGRLTTAVAEDARQEEERPNNLVGGIVGALLGGLAGAVVIVLLGQLGYVAVVSGLVMGFATLFLYQKLGGKLNALGIVICVVVMVLMTYFGHRMDWAISAAQYFEVGIFDAFRAIPELLKAEVIEGSTYWGDLALQYVFVAIGAIPTIISQRKSQKNKHKIINIK